jgi:hypothetical protein
MEGETFLIWNVQGASILNICALFYVTIICFRKYVVTSCLAYMYIRTSISCWNIREFP